MYFDTRIEYEYEMMNEMIENEMYNTRQRALSKLSSMIAHFTDEWALMIAYCYFDSISSAEKIADKLDLCKSDFLAIQEEFDAFKEEYLKNYEEAQNF